MAKIELEPTMEQRIRDLETQVAFLRAHKHGANGEVLIPF